jgi:hypothetical protein
MMKRSASFPIYASLLLALNIVSCQSNSQEMRDSHLPPNHLLHETSPYLLQHAHNPVEWYPWKEEAWARARKENKLVLVSIGYSSCHWCHVMERESFEDTAVARVMNENFICIKVDREERPDVDHVYMTAVQLMTGGGGWPLNCITLPDGRPIYGGTYFPKAKWIEVLRQLAALYKNTPTEAEEYASRLLEGIRMADLVTVNDAEARFHPDTLRVAVTAWTSQFDEAEGGQRRAPKFPMPNNYEFLLRYYYATGERSMLHHVTLTLDKMAAGGIYDHIGGGFARYSTDTKWKVPHFEKMLYDNAQLVSLYSAAYRLTKDESYRHVVYETCAFIRREMTSPEGGCYSALDADSEGEEGKFYVWKKADLQKLLGPKFPLFSEYYSVNETGYWEDGNYILLRSKSEEEIAKKSGIAAEEMRKEIADSKKLLLEERSKRIRPSLDDKQLTSWNALMIKAYCDAYNAFGDDQFLREALRIAAHNRSELWRKEGGYFHSFKNGIATVNAFLEDYAFSALAFIALYQCTFDETWLQHAKEVADYALLHFHDAESKMFFFTSDEDDPLITRKIEVIDNVIPSSNSAMAQVLFALSIYFDDGHYRDLATQMLNNVQKDFARYPSGYSNWMMLMLSYTSPIHEVVITGPQAQAIRKEMAEYYLPQVFLAGAENDGSRLSLLENRFIKGKTLIYVCENRTCKLPVESVTESLKLLKTRP